MKFVVGVLLASFGLFWGAEGAGAAWPGADISLLVIVPSVAVFCLLLVAGMRSYRLAHLSASDSAPADGVNGPASGGAGTARPTLGPVSTAPAGSTASGVATMATTHAEVAEETAPAVTSLAPVLLAPKPRGLGQRLAAIGLFLYDFVIGDDWQVAGGVALGLVVTALLAPVWPAAFVVTALFVAALLPYSIRRSLR